MAELSFRRDFAPQTGRSVPVFPGVRRVTAPNVGPLTFTGTNSYIVGSGHVAIIDPGPDDESHISAVLAATSGETITHILVTHGHRDHSGGARRLSAATGAPSHAAMRSDIDRDDASVAADLAPDIVLTDGSSVAGDGWRLEAVATPGHTPDHLVFALQGSDLIFSGDHVMAWSTTVVAPPEGSMADYMASLDRLLARGEDTYLPGHGGPVLQAHDHVRALKAHRRQRAAAILEALAAGAETVPAIVGAVYPDLGPELAGAAGLSVLAHLEEMIAAGTVASDGPPGPAARFRLSREGRCR